MKLSIIMKKIRELWGQSWDCETRNIFINDKLSMFLLRFLSENSMKSPTIGTDLFKISENRLMK